MWPFKRKVYPDQVGAFNQHRKCGTCDWRSPYPTSTCDRHICPKCGASTAVTVGRWIYHGKSEWSTDHHVAIRFEERHP